MKSQRILYALSGIDDRFIEEAAPGAVLPRPSGRRLVALMLAAALALLLVSCGVAAVIYGDSIQTWFSFYWHRLTGTEMAVEQTAVIDHLSQNIGLAQTLGDVTVTMDSATVSEDVFYLLIRVEGVHFSDRRNYGFDQFHLDVEPDLIADPGGIASCGCQFLGVDGDGSGLFLMDYQYSPGTGFAENTQPFEITLTLNDLISRKQGKSKTLTQGEWRFSFSLDRSQLPEALSLPDASVPGTDLRTGEAVDILLTDIVLTNTGIRFRYDAQNGNVDFLRGISVLLENGSRIEDGSGSGVPTNGTTIFSYSWHWPIPLNLEDIVSVRIGETEIPVP